MKKIISLLLVFILALSFSAGAAEAAAEIQVEVDGNRVVFPDVKPFTGESERTFVPVRFVSESLGAVVDWKKEGQAETVTIRKGNDNIVLTVGERKALVNGKEKLFDASSTHKDGRVCVPIRFVSECLGAEVSWKQETRTVSIFTGKKVDRLKDMSAEFNDVMNTVSGMVLMKDTTKPLLEYYHDGNPGIYKRDITLMIDDGYTFINLYDGGSLTMGVLKNTLKIYFPNSYEVVYNKADTAIHNTDAQVYKGYLDDRFILVKRFENVVGISIGEIGVKVN